MSYLGSKYNLNAEFMPMTSAAPSAGAEAAAGGFAMSNPATAGAMIGGQFLMNYMNQRAQERQQKQQALAQAKMAEGEAAANSGNMQQRALDQILAGYGRALT